MNIEKAVSIMMDASDHMTKEAGVPFMHTYSLNVPEPLNPVFVVMFGDSQAACDSAIKSIQRA